MAEEVHVGDIGTIFRATMYDGSTVLDISGASTLQLIFAKPDGTTLTKTAVLTNDGTDGIMEYITVDGDLDTKGDWKIQGYVALYTLRRVHESLPGIPPRWRPRFRLGIPGSYGFRADSVVDPAGEGQRPAQCLHGLRALRGSLLHAHSPAGPAAQPAG